MKKLLVLIIILLGAYLVADRYYPDYLNKLWNKIPQKTDETADWKTYRNEKFGFELTFTDAWKGYKVFEYEGSQGVGAPTHIQFSLPTSGQFFGVRNVTEEVIGYLAPFTITVINKDRKASGIVIAENNQYLYLYDLFSNYNELPDDFKNIDFEIPKIISTFKFIEPAADADISNWKTYRNEILGYQIKFPNGSVLSTEDLNLGAAGHRVVNDLPANAPYIVIKNVPSSVSICKNCGGYGVGTGNVKIKESIVLDGKIYNAEGFSSSDDKYNHKIIFVNLPDFQIVYGFASEYGQPLNQQEIDASNKLINQILSTFKFTK